MRPLSRTLAMINLDMVGRLEDEAMIVYGMGTPPEWEEVVSAANEGIGIALAYEQEGYGPSDHTSFYANDVPVLHLFTNVRAHTRRGGRVAGQALGRLRGVAGDRSGLHSGRDRSFAGGSHARGTGGGRSPEGGHPHPDRRA